MFGNKSKASFENLHPIFHKRIAECSKEDNILVSRREKLLGMISIYTQEEQIYYWKQNEE